jgi:hypothetical protein
MRPRSWTSALTVAVLLLACRSQALHAAKRPPAPKVPEPSIVDPWVTDGMSESVKDARDVAVDRAKERVLFFLSNQRPPLNWPGRDDYVDRHIREGAWVKAEEETPVETQDRQLQKVKLKVALTSSDYRAMVKLDREARAQQRQVVLVKGLAGVVVLLAVLAGFFRLNGTTKRASARSAQSSFSGEPPASAPARSPGARG